jgi:hypothetical protein
MGEIDELTTTCDFIWNHFPLKDKNTDFHISHFVLKKQEFVLNQPNWNIRIQMNHIVPVVFQSRWVFQLRVELQVERILQFN